MLVCQLSSDSVRTECAQPRCGCSLGFSPNRNIFLRLDVLYPTAHSKWDKVKMYLQREFMKQVSHSVTNHYPTDELCQGGDVFSPQFSSWWLVVVSCWHCFKWLHFMLYRSKVKGQEIVPKYQFINIIKTKFQQSFISQKSNNFLLT